MIKFKDILESNDAKKIVSDKLDTMNRIRTVRIPTPAERRAQIEDRKKKSEIKEDNGSLIENAFGWSTKKLDDGSYKWQVHKIEHNKPLTVLHSGESDTRNKAVALAKKHVMTYRKSSLMQENLSEAFSTEDSVVQHLASKGYHGIQKKDVTLFKNGAHAVHRGSASDKNYGKHFSIKKDGSVGVHSDISSAINNIKEENDPCWKGYEQYGTKIKKGKKVPNCIKEELDESLNHDHLQQSLADKDINSKIENGKLIVHKSNLAKAKAHAKKLGHTIEVKSGLNEGKMLTFKEYLNREIEHDESVELDESLVLEAVPTRTELMDKVDAHRKFGNNVTSHGIAGNKAHITVVDKEGIKRTYHYTSSGTKVETHGQASGSETAKTTKAPEEKRGRGRPAGTSGSYKRRVAEDLENSEELFLEDYDLEDLEEFYESEDFEMLDELSKTTLGNYIKKANKDYGLAKMFAARGNQDAKKYAIKRATGISTAVKKLTGE